MTDQVAVDWPRCDEPGCVGIQLPDGMCLAHATAQRRTLVLQQLHQTGEIDARGVEITEALLEEILAAAPHDATSHPRFARTRFNQATFKCDARFDGATFQDHASFRGATFEGDAGFGKATFQDFAGFGGATFEGDAGFGGATFQLPAGFGGATFQGRAGFVEATFGLGASFDETTFEGGVGFIGATFGSGVGFVGATFQDIARFGGATFQHVVGFPGATFQGSVEFDEVTFEGGGDFSAVVFSSDVKFVDAIFKGRAAFDEATFEREAGFGGATFHHLVGFIQATFQNTADFKKATFGGEVWFLAPTFQDSANFGGATFHHDAWFVGATFQDYASFGEATFQGDAWFDGATFQDHTTFVRAIFQGDVRFVRATFQNDASFAGAIVRRDARFVEAQFEQERQLGPLLVYGLLRLDGAHFARLAVIEASSRGLSCQRTRFPAGVQFRLRGAQVVLDDADLSSPSLLTGVERLSDARLAHREQRLLQAVRRLAPAAVAEYSEWPRLLSVRGANLAGLGVANIDLAQCRFAGAHNLDKLRFEAEVSFAAAPAQLPWDWRQVLAEERTWRAAQSSRWAGRWAAADWWPRWLDGPYRTEWARVVEPAQITGLYRALRKAREDAKDEPGAADFYYGEMEMRRHARRGRTGGASRGRVERALLIAYWLVSGYGLRAWRALAALAVMLVAFASLLVWGGYEDAASSPDAQPASTSTTQPVPSSSAAAPPGPPVRRAPPILTPAATTPSTAPKADRSLVGAMLYGARTIIGLNPTRPPVLTHFGEVLLITVRVLGPLLLGLALLAVRGRVKR